MMSSKDERPEPVYGVVLAAGAGTRLAELGRGSSKAMVPVAGRPLIGWVIARLRAAGVGPLIVVAHPADGTIGAFLRAEHADVVLVLQHERRGIADALRCALPALGATASYLACACDSLFAAEEVGSLIARGRTAPDAAVVGVLDMGHEATAARSAVRLEGERIVEIVEKPRPGSMTTPLVAAPLYWLPRALDRYIDREPPSGDEAYVSTALGDFIRDGGTVWAHRLSHRIEITTADDVRRAKEEIGDR
jgi:bifunctional UDP-N-acetylglucosamine pyrophosphorylase/glucosamine-1-phosphate N-acetyltransferase